MLLTRRKALAGSAVLASGVSRSANAALYFIFGTPVVFAACRQNTVPNPSVNDTTNNSLNSRMTCVAPSMANTIGLRLTFPGFGFNNPERSLPTSSYTVTAAVEYPAGIFHPFTTGGNRTLTVTAAEAVYSFDFLPIVIPAGSTYYIKTFVQWSAGNFWLPYNCAAKITTDWTARGTGLTDQTMTTAAQVSSSTSAGFGPTVYAAYASPVPSLGVIGDSIGFAGIYDTPNPIDSSVFIERAMRNVIPTLNVCRSGDAFTYYLEQYTGRQLLLNGLVTNLICEYGSNDLYFLTNNLATIQANAQTVWNQYLAQGMKVWATTITPRTTSTDGWATTANQTISQPTQNTVRLAYNAWLRANYVSLGLAGVIDFAHAIDPTDSGLWGADGTAGSAAAGFCTLSGGAVATCTVATYNGATTGGGTGYATSSTIACTVRGYPGETGTLPVITANTNGSGVVTGFNIVSPGSGLLYPPMVAVNGAWTADGIHPDARGYNEMIYQTALAPGMFT